MSRVFITGMGAVSALGIGVDALWSGLLAAKSGVRRLEEAAAMGLPVTSGGVVPFTGPDRDVEMARVAVDEALAQAALPSMPPEAALSWSCALDTFQSSPSGLVHRPAGRCFEALGWGLRGPRRMLAVACASGARAVGEAYHLIRRGRAEIALAGGSAVMLTPFYLIGFAALRAVALDEDAPDPARACRPFDAARGGFALADGAGALILESEARARRSGRAPIAEVIGLGTSMDAFDLNRPPADGAGAEACVRDCLRDAGVAPEEVDLINAHGTGTRVGDVAEARALHRIFGETPVHGIKGAIGHAMAAAGALEAIVAARALQTGVAPPTLNHDRRAEACPINVLTTPTPCAPRCVLSVNFGMGGQNAALLLRRVDP